MRNTHIVAGAILAAAVLALTSTTGAAQEKKKPATKADISKARSDTTFNREIFSGSESRIAAMNNVNIDCTSGPVPSLRIVTPPKNGQHRLEEIAYLVDRPAGNSRANCNGKPVTAVGVFYKSNADYVGQDNIVIDVDFKSGTVRRYNFKITVR
ncbi:MAG: hypothetical protein PSV22_18465 [Pseudolabrys sp.]|nr:hypothetical protein [Pseudolabrys sp.]